MIEFKYANREQVHHMYQHFIPDKMNQFNDFYKHIKCLKLQQVFFKIIYLQTWMKKILLEILQN